MVRLPAPPRSSPGLTAVSLLVASLLLVVAIAANQIGEALVADGLVDRAVFGWFVVVPLVLLSPGAAALAWPATGRRDLASRSIAVMSLAIGVAGEVVLVVAMSQARCAPVPDPVESIVPMAPAAFAAGAAFGLAGIVAMVSVGLGGRARVVVIRTLIAGALGLSLFAVAALAVLSMTFATAMCAAPQ